MPMLTKALLCLLLAVAGCGPFPSSDQPLPTATATLHWATITLPRSSYCWYMNGHGQCADSAGPTALLQSGYLKPYRTAGGFDARINFKAASSVHLFRAELVLTPPNVLPTPVSIKAATTITIAAVPPGNEGVYVYEVTGTWQGSGEVSFYLPLDLVPGTA